MVFVINYLATAAVIVAAAVVVAVIVAVVVVLFMLGHSMCLLLGFLPSELTICSNHDSWPLFRCRHGNPPSRRYQNLDLLKNPKIKHIPQKVP